MKFKCWLEMDAQSTLQWAKQADTDDTDQLAILADALEDHGYPNIATFRAAIERLRIANMQGMDKKSSYDGVYWEIRRKVIRLQTEAEHWLARHSKGVPWSGDYIK